MRSSAATTASSGPTPTVTDDTESLNEESAGISRRFSLRDHDGEAQKATATAKRCAYIRRHRFGIVTASGGD
jgi:hypothetical protein